MVLNVPCSGVMAERFHVFSGEGDDFSHNRCHVVDWASGSVRPRARAVRASPYPPPSQVYPAPPLYPAPRAIRLRGVSGLPDAGAGRHGRGRRRHPVQRAGDPGSAVASGRHRAAVLRAAATARCALAPRPAQVEEVEVPPPVGSINRDAALPPGLVPKPVYPPRQAYPPQQAYPQAMPPPSGAQDSYDPAAADTRPYYQGHPGLVPGEQQDALRPPMPISPGQGEPAASGAWCAAIRTRTWRRCRRGPPGDRTEEGAAAAVPALHGRLPHQGAGRHPHHRYAEHLPLPRHGRRQGDALWGRRRARGSPGRARRR